MSDNQPKQLRDYLSDASYAAKKIRELEKELDDIRDHIDRRNQEIDDAFRVIRPIAAKIAQEVLKGEPGAIYYQGHVVVNVNPDYLVVGQAVGQNATYLLPADFLSGKYEALVEEWLNELTWDQAEAAIEPVDEEYREQDVDGDGRISGYEALPDLDETEA